MAISFEEYVDRINKARSVDELLQVFLETVKQHGYDRMIFCLLSDHKQIGLTAGVGHLRNYPDDWMKYYFEQEFDKLDPVISYCYQKLGTFTWQEMSERLDLTRKQKLCLNLGTEAGLNNGICTPLWGPHRFAGIGLATTEKKDACDANTDIITAYCNHFYIAFQRLHAKAGVIKDTAGAGVFVTGPGSDIPGGMDNLGTITARYGIEVSSAGKISGEINNQGAIAGTHTGIFVTGAGSDISGPISNSGTISGGNAIEVAGHGDISGGVDNAGGGGILGGALGAGILVIGGSDISGQIDNAGTISGGAGIKVASNANISGGVNNETGGVISGGHTAGSPAGMSVAAANT